MAVIFSCPFKEIEAHMQHTGSWAGNCLLLKQTSQQYLNTSHRTLGTHKGVFDVLIYLMYLFKLYSFHGAQLLQHNSKSETCLSSPLFTVPEWAAPVQHTGNVEKTWCHGPLWKITNYDKCLVDTRVNYHVWILKGMPSAQHGPSALAVLMTAI